MKTVHIAEKQETKKKSLSCRKILVGVVIGSAALALILGLSIGLTRADEDNGNDSGAEKIASIGKPNEDDDAEDFTGTPMEVALNALESYPLIDGHNDLPYQFVKYGNYSASSSVWGLDLRQNLSSIGLHTDIPRMREGRLGAQFWVAFVSCDAQYKDATALGLDRVDIIKRFSNRYSDTFTFVTTAQGILDAFEEGKIASLVGLEGGHIIDTSLSVLRMFYELGVRYMTLTHSCNTPWADNWKEDLNATSAPEHGGLTNFGKNVVREMNRLGMMIDLSHVSKDVMEQTLAESQAPVIFSHSSAFALCNHYRNVQDDVLLKTKENGGVVMVNFYDIYISCSHPPNATLQLTADHIEHIRDIAGVNHVGIGADYDGIGFLRLPQGLEDVSKFPNLFEELVRRGWKKDDLVKLAGKNFIRVFKEVEKVRDSLVSERPDETRIPEDDVMNNRTALCRSPLPDYN